MQSRVVMARKELCVVLECIAVIPIIRPQKRDPLPTRQTNSLIPSVVDAAIGFTAPIINVVTESFENTDRAIAGCRINDNVFEIPIALSDNTQNRLLNRRGTVRNGGDHRKKRRNAGD